MGSKYKYILFDLDHTLWDFDANCRETLLELFDYYRLGNEGVDFELFFQNYIKINREVWSKYDKNKITKEEIRAYRFTRLLKIFKINNQVLAENLEKDYLYSCPKKGRLIPGTIELLDFVKKKYGLAVVTNGFEKTQREKVKYSGLDNYFQRMYTSESCGYKKPAIKYFKHVLNDLGLNKEDVLVVGDNPSTDIAGANKAGMDSIWVNTQLFESSESHTFFAQNMYEVKEIFINNID